MVFEYKKSKQGNVNIIQLSGELIDRNQAVPLLSEIETAVKNGENKFLLNLQELKYVNSSGLNVLINILTKSRQGQGDLAVCNVSPKVAQLMAITKLDSIFNVCESETAALDKLK